MSLSFNTELKQIAKLYCRELRRNQTKAEKIFWEVVRNRKFMGLKFYRQYPLFFDYLGKETFYIADFYCFEKKIVIEIDGKIHRFQKDHDQLRTFIINMLNINVIRFRNEEIEKDIDSIFKKLNAIIN
jgi:very-short-patch-repair endonuclease